MYIELANSLFCIFHHLLTKYKLISLEKKSLRKVKINAKKSQSKGRDRRVVQ